MPATISLKISGLNKTYKNGVKALDNVSVNIGPGMFGLLGPNGAGKSSLMRTIATLQNPDSGQIFFEEIDVLNNVMQLRRILGYLPQEFGVYPKMSAESLLNYFALLKGVSGKTDRQKLIQEVLEITHLSDVRKEYVENFSGGMKQRFGIAQVLLNKPRLLIVDEPTAGLDPAERNRFLNVLREVALKNTIIFSTHIVDDVKDLCNEMAIMFGGRILKQIAPSQAIAEMYGQIWVKNTDGQILPQLENDYKVLSSRYNPDNSVAVRVFSPEKPGDDFFSDSPQLEDVYFFTLWGSSLGKQE
ncbi:MAG: ABC transporter ATP-binding protein [Bacteroidia bacterium]